MKNAIAELNEAISALEKQILQLREMKRKFRKIVESLVDPSEKEIKEIEENIFQADSLEKESKANLAELLFTREMFHRGVQAKEIVTPLNRVN